MALADSAIGAPVVGAIGAPDESAKESSYFQCAWKSLKSIACLVFPFSFLWPTLLMLSSSLLLNIKHLVILKQQQKKTSITEEK